MPFVAAITTIQASKRPKGLGSMAEDPDGYMGCLEARGEYPKRRACFDDRCSVRTTCRLWAERDYSGYATKAMTWRTHWLCFDLPCAYFQPAINNEIAL